MNTPDKNKEYQDKDFPGYPHYPASEDATQANNNNGIVSIDADKTEENTDLDNVDIVMGTEADVTEADRVILDGMEDGRIINSAKDLLDNTDDDGEPLNEDPLDVPGSELDDMNEQIGEEDEENNYYSLGSDNNDNLESGDNNT
jgi:hypothetical protein